MSQQRKVALALAFTLFLPVTIPALIVLGLAALADWTYNTLLED